MRSRSRLCHALGLSMCLVAAASRAMAQAAPEGADASQAEAEILTKDRAYSHFQAGLRLSAEEAWSAALAEFLESSRLYPTKNATRNAAVCLRQLHRFDEALDKFESLLKDAAALPAELKTEAQSNVVELRALVGTIEVSGAEIGASITIDGSDRGDYPSPAPLRVGAGSHVLRVYKEGFEPFEDRFEVAGGQTVRAKVRLRALVRSGRLKIVEATDEQLEVVIDGITVGKTPWEGQLAVGNHTVVLLGEGDLGTQPVTVPVRLNDVTRLSLAAEALRSTLRIEPVPAGANVSIDSVNVGRGTWQGPLRAGSHTVEVAAAGFVASSMTLVLAADKRKAITVALERNEDDPIWKKPAKLVIEPAFGLAVAPSLGGDVAGSCEGACSSGAATGVYATIRAGRESASGFGLGGSIGYLGIGHVVSGRDVSLAPVGLPADHGTARDELSLRGAMVGAWAGLRIEGERSIQLRLGAGALVAQIADERTGTFAASDHTRFDVGPVSARATTTFVYADPEVRVGIRITERLELSAGVLALFLVGVGTPRWDDTLAISASTDGIGTFEAERLAGSFLFAAVPTLGVRYEL